MNVSDVFFLFLLICRFFFSTVRFTFSGPGARPAGSLRVFTIVNYCKTTVWAAITPGDNFGGGGFPLKKGESVVLTAPFGWSGRIWPRTGCNFDESGNGSCQTGSCGTSLKCSGSGLPPASLAEFTLAAVDFYDVSLVDGFNVPVVVKPINGNGNCSTAGCDEDVLPHCPTELQLTAGKTVVGCRSACDVFDTDEYCCRGVYGNPSTCKPTSYSRTFKSACPAAYSYAYDDPSSIFTCSGADYIVTFCSNRKQNVCSYKDGSLVCSGSGRPSRLLSGRWPLALQVVLFFSAMAWWVAVA
ncbi:hypothetical protein Taro_049970 [Colocasia esculenta]|uniref:Thaumatin-like protein n=1 Tax=Colocasia esculenta TaxID=4460 RepID=A0A843XCR0_COLES|nr:hypothetical protein [Colocasia esculenta]